MSEDKTTEGLLTEINERLGHLVALAAAQQVSGLKQKEAVEKLGAIGMSANAISEATGFDKGSVGPILSRAKNAKKR